MYRYGLTEESKSFKCIRCGNLFSINDVLKLEKAEFDEESYLNYVDKIEERNG